MKRISTVALAAMFLFSCAALLAQDTTEPPFKAPVCRGAVSAVSATSLTVKAADGDQVFTLTATTKVVGSKTAVADLAAGDHVTVTFKEEGGKKVATHVRVSAK